MSIIIAKPHVIEIVELMLLDSCTLMRTAVFGTMSGAPESSVTGTIPATSDVRGISFTMNHGDSSTIYVLELGSDPRLCHWKEYDESLPLDHNKFYDITDIATDIGPPVLPEGNTLSALLDSESLVVLFRYTLGSRARRPCNVDGEPDSVSRFCVVNNKGIFSFRDYVKRATPDWKTIATISSVMYNKSRPRIASSKFVLFTYPLGGAWDGLRSLPSIPTAAQTTDTAAYDGIEAIEVLRRALEAVGNPTIITHPLARYRPIDHEFVGLQAKLSRSLAPWQGAKSMLVELVDAVELQACMSATGEPHSLHPDVQHPLRLFSKCVSQPNCYITPQRRMVSMDADKLECTATFDIDHALTFSEATSWAYFKGMPPDRGEPLGKMLVCYKKTEIKCTTGPHNGPSAFKGKDSVGVRWSSVMWIQLCVRAQLQTLTTSGIPITIFVGLEYPSSDIFSSSNDASSTSSNSDSSVSEHNFDSSDSSTCSCSEDDFRGFMRRRQEQRTKPVPPRGSSDDDDIADEEPSEDDDDNEGVDADWISKGDSNDDENSVAKQQRIREKRKQERDYMHIAFRDALRFGTEAAICATVAPRAARTASKLFHLPSSIHSERLDVPFGGGMLFKVLSYAERYLAGADEGTIEHNLLSGRVVVALEAFGMKSIMHDVYGTDVSAAGEQMKAVADSILNGMVYLTPSEGQVYKRISVGMHTYVSNGTRFVDCGLSPFHGTRPWFNGMTAAAAGLDVEGTTSDRQPKGTSYTVAGLPQYTCYKTPVRSASYPIPFFPVNVQVYLPAFRDACESIPEYTLETLLKSLWNHPRNADGKFRGFLHDFLYRLWNSIPSCRCEYCVGIDGELPSAEKWAALLKYMWNEVAEKLYYCPNNDLRATGHVVICGWAAALMQACHLRAESSTRMSTAADQKMHRSYEDIALTCRKALYNVMKRSFSSILSDLGRQQSSVNRAYTAWPPRYHDLFFPHSNQTDSGPLVALTVVTSV